MNKQFNMTIPENYCTGYTDCWCEQCEGLYFTLQMLPADVLFDGDAHDHQYGARQNRWHKGSINRPRANA